MSDDPLLDTVQKLANEAEKADSDPTFSDLLDRAEERGYGPLIATLSAFVILPTGAIPGVPAIIGVALLLIGGQMLAGRASPWFPHRLRTFEIDGDRLYTALQKARRWADRLSALLSQRLHVLTNGPIATRLTALIVIASALIMIPLGFVPGLPLVFGATLLLVGLGITARDGLIALLGYAVFAVGCWLAWHYTLGR